jgi:hypothetical protein
VQWVVAVRGVEADFDVVGGAPMAREEFTDLSAKVPLDLEDESREARRRNAPTIREQLLDVGTLRVHWRGWTSRIFRAPGQRRGNGI